MRSVGISLIHLRYLQWYVHLLSNTHITFLYYHPPDISNWADWNLLCLAIVLLTKLLEQTAFNTNKYQDDIYRWPFLILLACSSKLAVLHLCSPTNHSEKICLLSHLNFFNILAKNSFWCLLRIHYIMIHVQWSELQLECWITSSHIAVQEITQITGASLVHL